MLKDAEKDFPEDLSVCGEQKKRNQRLYNNGYSKIFNSLGNFSNLVILAWCF